VIIMAAVLAGTVQTAMAQSSGWQDQVNAVFGAKGQQPSNDTLVFTLVRADLMPTFRQDLVPTLGGSTPTTPTTMSVSPALFLDGTIAFEQESGDWLVTIETPLMQREVSLYVQALRTAGLTVSAVHNHVIGEAPRALFVHAAGTGDAVTLAKDIVGALQGTGLTIPGDIVSPNQSGTLSGLDTANILSAIGHGAKGQTLLGSVFEVMIDRNLSETLNGVTIAPELGVEHDIHFQPVTGNSGQGSQSIAVAEFCLRQVEMDPVSQYLEQHGWAISAIHNHFILEQRRLVFVHAAVVGDSATEASNISDVLGITSDQ
jgi:hypothetical protein